jgi:hypothetical protein
MESTFAGWRELIKLPAQLESGERAIRPRK